jgi:hypothetical protein
MEPNMSEEMLVALENYIEAMIDQKIENAFGRDSLIESVRKSELRRELLELIFK